MDSFAVVASSRPVSWRALLLPREHGSWSLALEPLVLALLVAPSLAGIAIAVAAVALFLARRPWQAARAGDARFGVATGALGILGATAGAGLLLALAPVTGSAGLALLATLPAGIAFAWFDRRRAGRTAAAEMCGATFFAGFAAAIVLAAEGSAPLAIALGAFGVVRSVTSILTIRTFLRRRKGEAVSSVPATVTAVSATAAFFHYGMAANAWLPAAWTAVFVARAIWLLGPHAPRWTARRLGMTEAVLGVAVVLSCGLTW